MLNVQNSGTMCPNQFLESCSWFSKTLLEGPALHGLENYITSEDRRGSLKTMVGFSWRTDYFLMTILVMVHKSLRIKYSTCYVMKISKASNSKIGCTYNLLSFVKPLNTSGFMKESSLNCRFLSEECTSSFYC